MTARRLSTTVIVLGDRDERHVTHRELDAALALVPGHVDAAWIATDSAAAMQLAAVDGIWLAPGGPYASDESVLTAVDRCVDHGIPFLGTCSGFQYACLALARRAGATAVHAEVDPSAPDAMIRRLECALYGEERIVTPVAGTTLASECGVRPFSGFHYCGYGLAEEHEATIEGCGAVISARAPDMGAEAIELQEHPFFVATAFQPQVGTGDTGELHPLLHTFLRRADAHARARS